MTVSSTELTHEETWTLVITRGELEHWPDLTMTRTRSGVTHWRPEVITVQLRRGSSEPGPLVITGRRRNQDGSPGNRQRSETWYARDTWPEWADEAVTEHRAQLRLGPGVTGVDW
jgi:hypothetical protein